jgi:hypothetical protein
VTGVQTCALPISIEEVLATTAITDPIAAVIDAVVVTAERAPVLELTRTRLTIIAAHPDLVASGASRLGEQSGILGAHLRARGLEELTSRVIADAVTVAAFNGYLHWAVTESAEHPATIVRQALDALPLFG